MLIHILAIVGSQNAFGNILAIADMAGCKCLLAALERESSKVHAGVSQNWPWTLSVCASSPYRAYGALSQHREALE